MAIEDLNTCRTKNTIGLNREYYFLQSLLTALGNISKMLWPIIKRNDEEGNELRRARGNELRKALNVKDDSALKNRALRDLFEHFDERMDEWFGADDRRGFSDRNVGSMEGVIVPSGIEPLRTFVPKTWTLIFRKKEFKLYPAIEAVNELCEAVQSKIGQPGKRIKRLPGEVAG
jgi:hypothetical protein